jgi:hypothetical protein
MNLGRDFRNPVTDGGLGTAPMSAAKKTVASVPSRPTGIANGERSLEIIKKGASSGMSQIDRGDNLSAEMLIRA